MTIRDPQAWLLHIKTFLKLTTYLNKNNLNIVRIILGLEKSNDKSKLIRSNILLLVCFSVRLGNWYFVEETFNKIMFPLAERHM